MNTVSGHPGQIAATTTADEISAARDAGSEAEGSSTVRAAAWPLWIVLTLFWIYVALSNVLYSRSMSLSLDPRGVEHYFANWEARVLQHVFLYPLLVGAISVSLRCRWRPVWRAVPLQLALALGFSALSAPLLSIAVRLLDPQAAATFTGTSSLYAGLHALIDGNNRPYMVASTTSFFLAYGFALALATGITLFQRYRDSELRLATLERAWSGARLAALRMQLSPHTLFNLLHTIRGQIGWDPEAAQSMVVQLGEWLRRMLAAGESEFCPLGDEIRFVRLYLELQHRRFADRLQLTLPDASQVPNVWVPSLILQPLVENAVVHGLAGHSDPVSICLDVSVAADALVLIVSNTIAAENDPPRDGIGLRNVRERLAVHFGSRATLRAGRDGPRGWSAMIRIPLLYDGP